MHKNTEMIIDAALAKVIDTSNTLVKIDAALAKVIATSNALVFITAYRDFEKVSYKASEAIIKKVVPDPRDAKHLCSSWRGREKSFGSFFLNLDFATQADFLKEFEIEVPGIEEYKEFQKTNPEEAIFLPGPPTVMWLHELMNYFYNHSVSPAKYLSLPGVHRMKNVYGNSSNWADYILSISLENRRYVIEQLYQIISHPEYNK